MIIPHFFKAKTTEAQTGSITRQGPHACNALLHGAWYLEQRYDKYLPNERVN